MEQPRSDDPSLDSAQKAKERSWVRGLAVEERSKKVAAYFCELL